MASRAVEIYTCDQCGREVETNAIYGRRETVRVDLPEGWYMVAQGYSSVASSLCGAQCGALWFAEGGRLAAAEFGSYPQSETYSSVGTR